VPADAADAAPDWRIGTALGETEVSVKYKVALKKSKEGYNVSCCGLPGCWSQGKTEDEALENIQDAIREYLEAAVKISKGAEVREVEVSL
jgi:predicted RNase H-like HicB family nuclease